MYFYKCVLHRVSVLEKREFPVHFPLRNLDHFFNNCKLQDLVVVFISNVTEKNELEKDTTYQ